MYCCEDIDIDKDNPMYHETSLQEIKRLAESGDVFYAAGKGKWSDIVRFFSKAGLWSHVGIFIRVQKTLFILDVDVKTGVKLLEFDEYIKRYDGYFCGLRMLKNVTAKERTIFTTKLLEYEREIRGKKYSAPEVVAASVYRLNGHNPVSQRKLYCAQLVVKAYRHLGLLRRIKDERSSNALLLDFICAEGCITGYTGKARFKQRIWYADIYTDAS